MVFSSLKCVLSYVLLCIQIQTQYTDSMYFQIRNRLRMQHFLNHAMFFAQYIGLALGVGILLCHRLLMVDGSWLWGLWLLVPVLAVVQMKKNPVLKRHVLAYAEHQSGGSGFLWFEEEVGSSADSWANVVADKWSMVELPSLKVPSELKAVSLLLLCCVSLMWVPIRTQQSNHLPTVVKQEFESVQQEVAALEALVEESDPQIEAWKDTLSDLESGMSVGNTLRTLDDLSQQIEQRREEAMAAVNDAMDALEQGDTENLSKSMESLRKQNMIPSSAKDTESAEESAGQNSDRTDKNDGNSDGNSDGGQKSVSQKDMTPQQEQLSKQLQQLQSQLQQMQQSSSSSPSSSNQNSGPDSEGLKSYSNQDLQQLSESNQGQPQFGQSSSDQQGSQSGEGQGTGQGSGTRGGGTSPLTYGAQTDLIPSSNLRSLDGIPQVDWGNSVQFGTAPGQAGEVKTVPVSTNGSVQSVAPMTGQQQVAPQHRTAVKEFFAVEQTETND